MSIVNFIFLCLGLAFALVATLIVFYNIWIKKDRARRAQEMAEPQKYFRR